MFFLYTSPKKLYTLPRYFFISACVVRLRWFSRILSESFFYNSTNTIYFLRRSHYINLYFLCIFIICYYSLIYNIRMLFGIFSVLFGKMEQLLQHTFLLYHDFCITQQAYLHTLILLLKYKLPPNFSFPSKCARFFSPNSPTAVSLHFSLSLNIHLLFTNTL